MKTKIKFKIYNMYMKLSRLFWYISFLNPYKYLKKSKNSKKGESCIIIGTGPSLSLDDLELIKNTGLDTFSCNSIVKSYGVTSFRPKAYFIQDIDSFNDLKDYIFDDEVKEYYFANILKMKNKNYFKNRNNVHFYPLNLLNHTYSEKLKMKFSKKPFLEVFDGYSVTFSILQICVYMGYSNIYLCGIDCNYSGQRHFIDYNQTVKAIPTAGERMYHAWEYVKKESIKNNFNVYNISKNSKLDIFEKVDINDIK